MKLIFILLPITLFFSCENDFETPKPEVTNTNISANISMNSVISGLDSFDENIITFTDDLIIEAYVVSSDKGGNFFKELIIQDKTENPTTGIAIQIDERSLFERFPFGSKIYIQLNGLSIGYQKGVIKLGRLHETEIETLTAFLIDNHVFRTGELFNITPLSINLTTLTASQLNLYIELNQMQFPKELVEPTPKTLAAESSDSFDGLRSIYNCESALELLLSTSVFSSFKTLTIPSTTGNIKGVLTRDFDNLHYVLKMNSAGDINFTNESRCDESYFECIQNGFEATNLLLNENFEEITNENLLEPLGWLNINITGDEKRWTDKKITNVNNRVLTLSAFNSNLQPLHVWLVTPEINIDNTNGAYVQFRVRTLFNNGDALKVWVTDAFNEDITVTDWKLLNVDLPNSTSNYITVKKDISCLSGNIRIGFEYKGYDSILTSTYDIDDVIIGVETKN